MLAAMSEKQECPKPSQKASSKKSAAKRQSKAQNTTALKKTRNTAARKKPYNKVLSIVLILLCISLIGFNLLLITKRSFAGKRVPYSDIGQRQGAAETVQTAEQYTENQTAHEHQKTPKQSSQTSSHRASVLQTQPLNIPHIAPKSAKQQTKTFPQTHPGEKQLETAHIALHAKPEQPKKQIPYAGTITFVFDDAGHNLTQLEHFLRLPFPCTIAVLPGLRYSSESAFRIREAGKQVILHQPMQSVDVRIDPGPGAIKPGFSAKQIKSIVRKNLEEIWPVAGMNNHEGSLITTDKAAMKAVLEVVAEKDIFFLDSRTTARSIVTKVAKEQNMTVWERAIFIDNDKSRKAMEAQIQKGLGIAKRTGSAIMIGHVFTVELAELLTEMYPMLVEEGFSLSTIAQTAQRGSIR